MTDTTLRDSSTLIAQLKHVLADAYTMMVKYHNYHRNVTGPHFFALHEFFQTQYESLFESIDEIAEVLRQYRVHAPGTMKEFAALTSIEEFGGEISATEMQEDLARGHTIAIQTIESAIHACDDVRDEATHDMLNDMMEFYSKTLWMLEASLAA